LQEFCSGLSDLERVAANIFEYGRKYNLWLLKGEMGSGKTTFINVLAAGIGVLDKVNSPSFGIVNEYQSQDGQKLYHFDFFRIKSPEEAFELGFFEYIDSGNYCFIEWPEMIEPFLKKPFLEIIIKVADSEKRNFNVEIND
jgi:tRNA threonylcarbamoyladenosine biosynthesis protein TsaE